VKNYTMSITCDACAGDVPLQLAHVGLAWNEPVTVCSPACLDRLQRIWAPTERKPNLASRLMVGVAFGLSWLSLGVSLLFVISR
jgi:hypothetical protein